MIKQTYIILIAALACGATSWLSAEYGTKKEGSAFSFFRRKPKQKQKPNPRVVEACRRIKEAIAEEKKDFDARVRRQKDAEEKRTREARKVRQRKEQALEAAGESRFMQLMRKEAEERRASFLERKYTMVDWF